METVCRITLDIAKEYYQEHGAAKGASSPRIIPGQKAFSPGLLNILLVPKTGKIRLEM